MQLVEQHCNNKSDPRYVAIDTVTFASKNLNNQATYHFRQASIHERTWLSYAEVFHRIKLLDCYRALPSKVSNSILILIDKHWHAFRNALKEGFAHAESVYLQAPPHLSTSTKRQTAFCSSMRSWPEDERAFKKTGKLVPSGLQLEIQTKMAWESIEYVRIVPRGSYYVAEVVYTVAEQRAAVGQSIVTSIDLGVNVLAAITSTRPGFAPTLVNGRPLKDLNHSYNQHHALHQSRLAKQHRKPPLPQAGPHHDEA